MNPSQQLVMAEKTALDEKLTKLNTFMLTDDFDKLSDAQLFGTMFR